MLFPFFFDLSDKEVLIVGAGHIAERRIRVLLGYVKNVRIVADQVSPGIQRILEKAKDPGDDFCTSFALKKRKFLDSDLEGADFVLAATDDEKENARIFSLCRDKKIPVNVCTDAGLCDFQFPSIVEDGSTVIGINASGLDHALVKQTRQKIEKMLGSDDLESKYE